MAPSVHTGTFEDSSGSRLADARHAPCLYRVLSCSALATRPARYVLEGLDHVEFGRASSLDAKRARRTIRVGLPDRLVSSQHARLFRRGGRWEIEDRDSKNGTTVDGVALARTGTAPPPRWQPHRDRRHVLPVPGQGRASCGPRRCRPGDRGRAEQRRDGRSHVRARPGRAASDRQPGRVRLHRRGNRSGERGAGPVDSRALGTPRRLRGRQLRSATGDAHRERTVRPPEGSLLGSHP